MFSTSGNAICYPRDECHEPIDTLDVLRDIMTKEWHWRGLLFLVSLLYMTSSIESIQGYLSS